MTPRMPPPVRAIACVLLTASVLTACSRELGGDTRLDGERRISDVVDSRGYTVVLFYRPEDCFGCLTTLEQWRRLEREGIVRIAVVLDRDPTDSEAQHLRAERITVAGVYRPHWLERRHEGPLEFLADSSGRKLTTTDTPGVLLQTSALQLALAMRSRISVSDTTDSPPRR